MAGQTSTQTGLGGRYWIKWDRRCTGWDEGQIPWLVPLFGDVEDAPERHTCRGNTYPFGDAERSARFADANPMPDGRSIVVDVKIIDGALLNQRTLFVLIEHELTGVFGETETSYGYMLLHRATGEALWVESAAGAGVQPPSNPVGASNQVCPDDLLRRLTVPGFFERLGNLVGVRGGNERRLRSAEALISGLLPPAPESVIGDDSPHRVHWLCKSTGRFDGGSDGIESCPSADSRLDVKYFTLRGNDDLSRLDCQTNNARKCDEQLEDWTNAGYRDILVDPACTCQRGLQSEPQTCDVQCPGFDRGSPEVLDPRQNGGLTFYAVPSSRRASDTNDGRSVNYLCIETGQFNRACPETSEVVYFLSDQTEAEVQQNTCQTTAAVCSAGEQCIRQPDCEVGKLCSSKGTCTGELRRWVIDGEHGVTRLDHWTCDDLRINCDMPIGTHDRREGKTFVRPESVRQVMRPFDAEVADGFRYRSRFRNRSGLGIGFAPEACIEDQNAIPYCYDAEAIEVARERVDCLQYIYRNFRSQMANSTRNRIESFLQRVHSYSEQRVAGLPTPVIEDGFERAYAELLVMLGDESVTRAFSSRFDLAGQRLADFPGSQFEPKGIDLSGQAGFELYSFYQAAQYYRLVLDRFFEKADFVKGSIGTIIDARTATAWLPRVLAASTKKARVWAEVAERYIGFKRPDLARDVIRRAFAGAWFESVLILQLYDRVQARSDTQTRDQVRTEKQRAQLVFSSALRDMQSAFADVLDEPSFFGIPNNFVPFPAIDPRDTNSRAINAFDVALERARNKTAIAIESEAVALSQKRDFDTEGAAFQAEMADLKHKYDNDLSELCGSFEGDDGNIYPAVSRYASLGPLSRGISEPCGLLGNGTIFSKLQEVAQSGQAILTLRARVQEVNDRERDLNERIRLQCGRVKELADYTFEMGDHVRKLRRHVDQIQTSIDSLGKVIDEASEVRDAVSCTVGLSTDCATSATAMIAYTAVVGFAGTAEVLLEIGRVELEDDIEDSLLVMQRREITEECDAITIDLRDEIQALVRSLPELQSEVIEAQIYTRQLRGELRGLLNDAASTMANREESEQLRINAEVARNDPNVRIYRNEAMITADNHFYAALREAYKATRVFEYYTTQSYGARDELLLIRLAGRGERNLRDYLLDLEEAFFQFEQLYSNPDLRLHIVSLRDLLAPRLENNVAVSDLNRTATFRTKLEKAKQADPRDYATIRFRTGLDNTSPLTADHKILYIEADLVGDNLGDALGRVYVQLPNNNTGTVRGVDSSKAFYVFPQRSAVLNTTFNGKRGSKTVQFDRGIYRNERFRDRPLVNSQWEVMLNTRDEQVNADIRIDELKDIVIYIYYTDFTTEL